MGRAEGPAAHHGVLLGGEAHDGVDFRAGQGLRPGQVGEDAGQALGHHGLARAGGAGHEHVVPPGGSHLQRPLGVLLSLYLAEIGVLDGGGVVPPNRGGGKGYFPGQVGCQLCHRAHGEHLQTIGQGGLRGVVGGDKQPGEPRPPGGQSHGQYAGHRAKPPVQRQLA